jgi:signal peptidase I
MLKPLKRIINFRTAIIVFLYIVLKNENQSFITYEIKEESMSPELLPEDYIFALKVKNEIKRGDIVVFKNEEKGIDVVKRVVGLPGETISSADGSVLINNEPLSNDWATTITDDFIKYEIEDSELFVIGDNRKLSTSDSRTLGAIKIDKCLKVKYRYWPYQRIKSYE